MLWLALLLAQKIDLSTADLGRHLKNGEIIIESDWADKLGVLKTNFYSYTEGGFSFVNHHWLSGVLFYGVFALFGFGGLSVFYIILYGLAFLLLFRLANKEIGINFATLVALSVIPILTNRQEIRPEVFTYLFSAIFFYILHFWYKNNSGENFKTLIALPILMLFWVNLHIGFVVGFAILGVFWLDSLIRYKTSKDNLSAKKSLVEISKITVLSFGTSLINPAFLKGALYPFSIFSNYGYRVLENQSIIFLENLNISEGLHFGLIKLLYFLIALSFLVLIFKKDWRPNFRIGYFVLIVISVYLSFTAIRNFPIFALFFMSILALNIKPLVRYLEQKEDFRFVTALVLSIILIIFSFQSLDTIRAKQNNFGIGLADNINAAANFWQRENIKGPIFNNYDIGGYLIYNVFPTEKVFVDNRPEAYSLDFFVDEYVPAQEAAPKWNDLLQKYKFNAIFFSHRDQTPWGQNFLVTKINDPEWAPIFADAYHIIFVRRNSQNFEIIKRNEIPKDRFGVR